MVGWNDLHLNIKKNAISYSELKKCIYFNLIKNEDKLISLISMMNTMRQSQIIIMLQIEAFSCILYYFSHYWVRYLQKYLLKYLNLLKKRAQNVSTYWLWTRASGCATALKIKQHLINESYFVFWSWSSSITSRENMLLYENLWLILNNNEWSKTFGHRPFFCIES